jgi:hypothetical protein
MGYWCALWFWPVEQAHLLPTRDEFLIEVGSVLEGTLRATQFIRPTQGNMFGPEQPSLSVADEFGFVDLNALCKDSERLTLVREIAERHRFFHWDLEFADVFADRGGFDLILGNPPWIKVEWNEGAVMGDVQPLYVLRDYSAPQLAQLRTEAMERYPGLCELYLDEYVEFEGTQWFLNAKQNYPLLLGSQSNTYKCFVTKSWDVASARGVQGFLHPEGVYDDPKGGVLRAALYRRSRYHFHFRNEKQLFPEIDHHMTFSANVYSPPSSINGANIANLITPTTVDASFDHHGHGPVPGIKNDQNEWNDAGHAHRVVHLKEDTLALFAKLYDEPETVPIEARLPALHAHELVEVLRKFADYPRRLSDIAGDYTTSEMWHETNAVHAGTIRRETMFGVSIEESILCGPHVYVANPWFKTPRANAATRADYDAIDLACMPSDYLPRSNHVRACALQDYQARQPHTPWNAEKLLTDLPRLVSRRRMNQSGERTLLAALYPAGPAHINACFSLTFASLPRLLQLAGGCASLPFDFFVKTTGKGDFRHDIAGQLPLLDGSLALFARTLLLNCLTRHYTELWRECFDPAFTQDRWAKHDPRLDDARFGNLTADWSWHTPLRTDYERRQALVEIDVLVAMELGLTCDELCTSTASSSRSSASTSATPITTATAAPSTSTATQRTACPRLNGGNSATKTASSLKRPTTRSPPATMPKPSFTTHRSTSATARKISVPCGRSSNAGGNQHDPVRHWGAGPAWHRRVSPHHVPGHQPLLRRRAR